MIPQVVFPKQYLENDTLDHFSQAVSMKAWNLKSILPRSDAKYDTTGRFF